MSDDWINLAHELGFQTTDIAQIQKEYPDSAAQQCMSMLNIWMNEVSGQDSGTIYLLLSLICFFVNELKFFLSLHFIIRFMFNIY